ncbi:MAG: ATP-dependent protease subunit HslV [Alphaproteobacteria bacterium]|nr:ATP-dependent protease subunit HslV [Alphaproteobacteria bacterium]MBQ7285891.1 ATP-dependent protease subunit HslV [Alphaproteobacteria bacterium]
MTTILCVRRNNEVVMAGDGQATLGEAIVFKSKSVKVRRIGNGQIIAGFAGAAADGITLIERLESKLEKHANQLKRAAVELAKDWRMDKYLRQLQAFMIVADKETSLVISGTGEVMEPDDGIIGIGSGGNYAMAAAKALYDIEGLTLEDIANRAMNIAGNIDVYTNHNVIIERICNE